jgi:hypothetical protein
MILDISLFKGIIKSLVMDLSNKNYNKIKKEKINGRVNIIELENIQNNLQGVFFRYRKC